MSAHWPASLSIPNSIPIHFIQSISHSSHSMARLQWPEKASIYGMVSSAGTSLPIHFSVAALTVVYPSVILFSPHCSFSDSMVWTCALYGITPPPLLIQAFSLLFPPIVCCVLCELQDSSSCHHTFYMQAFYLLSAASSLKQHVCLDMQHITLPATFTTHLCMGHMLFTRGRSHALPSCALQRHTCMQFTLYTLPSMYFTHLHVALLGIACILPRCLCLCQQRSVRFCFAIALLPRCGGGAFYRFTHCLLLCRQPFAETLLLFARHFYAGMFFILHARLLCLPLTCCVDLIGRWFPFQELCLAA